MRELGIVYEFFYDSWIKLKMNEEQIEEELMKVFYLIFLRLCLKQLREASYTDLVS